MNTADYLELLDWTGHQIAFGKRGHIAADAPSVLHAIERSPQRWTQRVLRIGNGYWRVVGTAEDLIGLAKQIAQRWLKELAFARSFDRSAQRSMTPDREEGAWTNIPSDEYQCLRAARCGMSAEKD